MEKRSRCNKENQKDTHMISCVKALETDTGLAEDLVLRTHHIEHISLLEGGNRN